MGSHSISRQYSASRLVRMNFLVTSLGFLAVATGLPFPQEFLSPPSQVPPTIYQLNSPPENYRGFRAQQIVPEGNTVSKVVIQVPNNPSQRTHDGFQRNPIVQHYYPDNGQNQQVTQIQYQDVTQRIQYVPQGVPENMPRLFLPAQPVAQAVEQVPQGIHYSVQRSEQVPQTRPQALEVPVQQINALSANQNNFVQKVAQAVADVRQQGISESVQNIQQISTDGPQLIIGYQPGSVQLTKPYVAVNQISKESGVDQGTYDKNVQTQPQSIQSEAQTVNNIPPEQSSQQGNYVTVQLPQDSLRPQNQQQANYVAVQQSQDSLRPQNEQQASYLAVQQPQDSLRPQNEQQGTYVAVTQPQDSLRPQNDQQANYEAVQQPQDSRRPQNHHQGNYEAVTQTQDSLRPQNDQQGNYEAVQQPQDSRRPQNHHQGNYEAVTQTQDSLRPQNDQQGNYEAVQQPQDSRTPQNEQQADYVAVTQSQDSRRPQNHHQGNYEAVTQTQDSRTPQNDHHVQEAPKDTYSPQRTPAVQAVVTQQHQDSPEQAVVTVQHGPNGVQIIRQGEPNTEQQLVHQNLVHGVKEQFQNIHKTESNSVQNTIQHQPTDVQREQVVHPLVHVIQHGAQGVQIIREGEQNRKYAELQRPNVSFSQPGQKADNTIGVQQVSRIPNNQIDQREPSGVQQPAALVQHEPNKVNIIRQEEVAQQSHNHRQQQTQQQQGLQQNIQSTQPGQSKENAAPVTQSISQGGQPISNQSTPTAQNIAQVVFYGDEQKPRPDEQTQGQASYEAGIAKALPPSQVQTHQSESVQVKPTIPTVNPNYQTHQVSHFSSGFQEHSSAVKQENQNTEAGAVSHFTFGTQAVANQDAQKIEAPPQTHPIQEIQTKPHHPPSVSSSAQQLPPGLHQTAQNVVEEVPQVSQTIKEASHGVQAIPAAVEQVSQRVQQLTQGVQQAFQGAQQVNPVTDGVRNVYQGIRNSVHPAILSSAEAFVNAIQRDKEPVHSQQLQKVLDQIQLVRQEVRHKQESIRQQVSPKESALDQEIRQIPFQEEEVSQQNQKPFQSGFHPFQNQGQRSPPARPPYGNRKPVQSAPVNQIYDNTPYREESLAEDDAEPTPIPIIRYENSVGPDGTFQWSYEAGNGIKAQESGLLRNRGDPEKESIAVQGGYSYTGPDGILYSVEYIADENGFQPLGRHLPTQPPLPEALQKAIDEHMAILATAQPDTDEQAEEPVQTDNILGSSQNMNNYSQRVS